MTTLERQALLCGLLGVYGLWIGLLFGATLA